MSQRFAVEFHVEAADGITFDDIKEWVEFETGARSDLRCANPLMDRDLEPVRGSFRILRTRAI